ncbi:MAG: hypothetical protein AAF693_19290 [Bacteroidota bacterium]
MKLVEIIRKLEQVNFTTEQARTITELLEEHHHQLASKEDVKSIREDISKSATNDDVKNMATKDAVEVQILKAKYDLVKWIVGGVIANGLVATLLKYLG